MVVMMWWNFLERTKEKKKKDFVQKRRGRAEDENIPQSVTKRILGFGLQVFTYTPHIFCMETQHMQLHINKKYL